MKLFKCQYCNNPLYFENNTCLECGHPVGFWAGDLSMITLHPEGGNTFQGIQYPNTQYHYCQNAAHNACNWLILSESKEEYCFACNLNEIIPDISKPENLYKWQHIETAKHRLIYTLLRMTLPIKSYHSYPSHSLAFEFKADSENEKVITGHHQGTITINLNEADEATRVKHKLDLGEKYRTLLGHFRHEVGHYYWDVCIKSTPYLDTFRRLFGDETADYAQALKIYYENGAPTNWATNYISPYATSHPWEDWAETWAHYLHLMDTLETAHAFGLGIDPEVDNIHQEMSVEVSVNPYQVQDFRQIMKMWLPLTLTINSLNRSMGYGDFYPFIIQDMIVEKLSFIHQICQMNRATY